MNLNTRGPLLTDAEFFTQCLDLDLPGLHVVKSAAAQADWSAARDAFGAFIRALPTPCNFFDIPYEPPENMVTFPDESEAQACERIAEHTLISVGVPCAYGRKNPVDWQANPTYNGYMEWPFQLNRHHELKMLAHQYRLTGQKKLSDCAAELLASWLSQALFPGDVPGYETLCWRTIECGIRTGCTWPYVFYAFHQTDAFNNDLLTDWLKSYVEHGRRMSRNHMSGNWLIMEMNGLAHISLMFPFLREAKNWLSQSFQSLEEELEKQVYPDGFQYELTTNYHNVIIINYQRLLSMCRVLKYPVPQGILNALSRAIGLEAMLMMPDRTTPDINDGHRYDVARLMQIRRDIFPNHPAVRYLADGDASAKPDYTSLALPYSGFMVMRTGWTAADSWALFDGGPFGRAHQHEDKLNVLFYANGQLLLTEGGNYAYDQSAMRSYVLDTTSHNTVRVDSLSQNRREYYRWEPEMIGQKAGLRFHCGEQWDYGEADYSDGYGKGCAVKALHSRRVFFSREAVPLLIVVDRMRDATTHTYEWLWHVDSDVKENTPGHVRFELMDAVFSQGQAEIVVGQESPHWQGFIATGTKQGMYRAVPCLCVRQDAPCVRMVSAFAPYSAGGKRLVRVEASGDVKADAFRLIWSDGSVQDLLESDLMNR